jgi:probable HAF family extracellular repeat protein
MVLPSAIRGLLFLPVLLLLAAGSVESSAATFSGVGDLPGGAFLSEARAAFADGSVVVGWSNDNETQTYGAFRWREGSGMVALPDFWAGSAYWHSAEDVTAAD